MLCYFFFLFFFFSAKILSGPYLWNRYSQRLQIEYAAWSCGLILHYCLPSNSLCYFFFSRHDFATILSGPYLWNRYSQKLIIECAAWSCGLILHYCLPSNSLRYFYFFFCHDFVRRRVFHLRGIAPRSHTGRPRTCLVICAVSSTTLFCNSPGATSAPNSSRFLFRNLGIVPNAPVTMRTISTGLSHSLLSSVHRSWYLSLFFFLLQLCS